MPHLREVAIIKAWRHAGEVDRIHYMLRVNTTQRHLYVDKGSKGGLYGMLETYLESVGYTGPASAEKENAS